MTDDQPGAPDAAPLYSEPGECEKLGDDGLLAILEGAIADERAAQEKYRRGLECCADHDACKVFEQLLLEEEAHERALVARYNDVKKRIGLRGAGRAQV